MRRESLLPLKDVGGDPNTPRTLLSHGSQEWCYRTVWVLRSALDSVTVSELHFREILDELVAHRAWEKLPSPESHYASLDDMLMHELGVTEEQATAKKVAQQCGERVQAAAQDTTGGVLPAKGYVAERVVQAACATTGEVAHGNQGRQIAHPNSQSRRAAENGIGFRTQRKLDRLKNDFAALFERVKAGELSVHRACIEAGLAEPTFSCSYEPTKAARRILKHFRGADLDTLVGLLSDRTAATENPAPERGEGHGADDPL